MQNGKRVRGGGVQSQNMKIYMDNIQYLKKTTITYVSTKCENTIVNFEVHSNLDVFFIKRINSKMEIFLPDDFPES